MKLYWDDCGHLLSSAYPVKVELEYIPAVTGLKVGYSSDWSQSIADNMFYTFRSETEGLQDI